MPGPLFSLSLLKEVFSSLLISFQVRGNPERSIGESGREMQNDYRLKKKTETTKSSPFPYSAIKGYFSYKIIKMNET